MLARVRDPRVGWPRLNLIANNWATDRRLTAPLRHKQLKARRHHAAKLRVAVAAGGARRRHKGKRPLKPMKSLAALRSRRPCAPVVVRPCPFCGRFEDSPQHFVCKGRLIAGGAPTRVCSSWEARFRTLGFTVADAEVSGKQLVGLAMRTLEEHGAAALMVHEFAIRHSWTHGGPHAGYLPEPRFTRIRRARRAQSAAWLAANPLGKRRRSAGIREELKAMDATARRARKRLRQDAAEQAKFDSHPCTASLLWEMPDSLLDFVRDNLCKFRSLSLGGGTAQHRDPLLAGMRYEVVGMLRLLSEHVAEAHPRGHQAPLVRHLLRTELVSPVEEELALVAARPDGCCRWGCGQAFAVAHLSRREHEAGCSARPLLAVAKEFGARKTPPICR